VITVVQLELKHVSSGSRVSVKVRPADKIDVVELRKDRARLLYRQSGNLVLMDPVSFEQFEVSDTLAGGRAHYLRDNTMVGLVREGDTVLKIVVPDKLVCTVLETSGDTKNSAADGGYKVAKLDIGTNVSVPMYVANGMHIVVNTTTNSYAQKSDKPPSLDDEGAGADANTS
jgi:elongation factor P